MSALPVIALPHPLILLPTGRITLPVSRGVGEALLNLVQESDDQPIVAAVPLTSPNGTLHEWGTASRIVRLIKPPSTALTLYHNLSSHFAPQHFRSSSSYKFWHAGIWLHIAC